MVKRRGSDEDRSIFLGRYVYTECVCVCVYVYISYDKVETDPKADPF